MTDGPMKHTFVGIMTEQDALEGARRKVLAAAEAIYRLTDTASFEPALKDSLRRHATEILGGVTGIAFFTEARKTHERERLMALAAATRELLSFAGQHGLISRENAGRVAAAYGTALDLLGAVHDGSISAPADIPSTSFLPNERQSKIIAHLSGNGRAQLGDIKQLFGDAISEKTIQRDLWQLVSCGLIQRHGDNRWTVYSLRQP